MEKITLWFQPGDRQEGLGFRWSASYKGKMVGLCNQPFCEICDSAARDGLRDFRGGNLEVNLTLHYRPSFWQKFEYYLGHLVAIPKEVVEVDEGQEFDVSGSNACVYAAREGAILVDPGWMGFRGEEPPLEQFIAAHPVAATIVTHGHLDHHNKMRGVRSPVFLSPIAFHLASRHAYLQRDRQLEGVLRGAKTMVPGQPVLFRLPVRVDAIPLPHSIPETMGLVIRGEKARVLHLGDFKLAGMFSRPKAEIIKTLCAIATGGVDLLALTIFNSHIEGFTPPEALAIDSLTNILARAERRVIITCFSTNLARILKIAEVARVLGRSVSFCGAGMRTAQELTGIRPDLRADSEKPVIFVTGCQAEEYSVLWRLSNNQNPSLELRPDDILVFSSRCIPGNEAILKELIGNLKSQVGEVVVSKGELGQLGLEDPRIEEEGVHVSGHGNAGDIRLVLEILRPRRVLPWPQVSPQIEAFREIAKPLGIEILDEKERVIEV